MHIHPRIGPRRHSNVQRSLALLVTAGGLLLAGGCSAPASPISELQSQWASPLIELDYVPLKSLSEDVRVGDVYLLSDGASIRQLPFGVTGHRWTKLPVSELLAEQYERRGEFPETPEEYLLIEDDEHERLEPTVAAGGDVFVPNPPTTRLPFVAMTGVANLRIEGEQVERLVPPEVLNVIPGARSGDPAAVRISIASAESYALGLSDLLPLVLEPGGEDLPARFSAGGDSAALLAGAGARPIDSLRFVVVSEVVFVRAVDITHHERNAVGDDELVDPDELEVPEDADGDEQELPEMDTGAADDAEAEDIDPVLAVYARANAVNELLVRGDLQDTPVGSIRVLSVTDDSITVRRFFRRGLAVAVRGVLVEVDAASLEVRSVTPLP